MQLHGFYSDFTPSLNRLHAFPNAMRPGLEPVPQVVPEGVSGSTFDVLSLPPLNSNAALAALAGRAQPFVRASYSVKSVNAPMANVPSAVRESASKQKDAPKESSRSSSSTSESTRSSSKRRSSSKASSQPAAPATVISVVVPPPVVVEPPVEQEPSSEGDAPVSEDPGSDPGLQDSPDIAPPEDQVEDPGDGGEMNPGGVGGFDPGSEPDGSEPVVHEETGEGNEGGEVSPEETGEPPADPEGTGEGVEGDQYAEGSIDHGGSDAPPVEDDGESPAEDGSGALPPPEGDEPEAPLVEDQGDTGEPWVNPENPGEGDGSDPMAEGGVEPSYPEVPPPSDEEGQPVNEGTAPGEESGETPPPEESEPNPDGGGEEEPPHIDIEA